MARKRLETLTEQMFYVLLSLRGERHGYGIMQAITELTGGRVSVGAGTLYAPLGSGGSGQPEILHSDAGGGADPSK